MLVWQAVGRFEAAGGRSMQSKIEDVLTGLGFSRAASWLGLSVLLAFEQASRWPEIIHILDCEEL